jgi:Uma2 family endonuclease
MATQPHDVRMTLTEFLDWDDGTDTVYELIDGQIFAMTSPHWKHASVLGRLVQMIGAAIDVPCQAFVGGGVVPSEVDDTWLVPDLVVIVGAGRDHLDDQPGLADVAVVFALPPHSERRGDPDGLEKRAARRALAS